MHLLGLFIYFYFCGVSGPWMNHLSPACLSNFCVFEWQLVCRFGMVRRIYLLISCLHPCLYIMSCECPSMAWLHTGWHGPCTCTFRVRCEDKFRPWLLYNSNLVGPMSVPASYYYNTTNGPLIVITPSTLHVRIMLRLLIWLLPDRVSALCHVILAECNEVLLH